MYLIWNLDESQFKTWIKREYGRDDIPFDGAAKHIPLQHTSGTDGHLIAIKQYNHKDPYCLGFLAHEVNHVVQDVLDTRGMKQSDETGEAYAYLTEWLMRSCVAILLQK